MGAVASYLHPTVTRLVDEGRVDRALEVLGAGACMAREHGLHEEFVSCLVDRAILLRHRGQEAEAVAALAEAEESMLRIDDLETLLILLRTRASLTSPAWTNIDRLQSELLHSAARGEDLGLVTWAVSDEAASLLRAGDAAGAAVLFAALAETDHPIEVSGVPVAPTVGLASALYELGCVTAAAEVLAAVEESYAQLAGIGGGRRCLFLAERGRLLVALGRADAAEDLRRQLAEIAPAALRRLEGRILELCRSGRTRPSTFLVAAIHDWEAIARGLADRNAVVRCWLEPDEALRITGSGDDACVAALRLLAETALLESCDRLFRRAKALQTIAGVDAH